MKHISITDHSGTGYLVRIPEKYDAVSLVTTRNREQAKEFEPGEAILLAGKISANNPHDLLKVEVVDVAHRRSL